MKRLHKKIGVGVLVAGLVLGAGGLSKGSVAHASSGGVKLEQQSDLEKRMDKLGKKKGFYPIKIDGEEEISKLFGRNIKQVSKFRSSFKNYNHFSGNIKKILNRVSDEKPFIYVRVGGSHFILVYLGK